MRPQSLPIPTSLPTLAVGALGLVALATSTNAQHTTFSIDPPSPSEGSSDCSGAFNLRAADILEPDFLGGVPGLAAPSPVCIGARGGGGVGSLGLTMPLVANVDALSYGTDAPLGMNNMGNRAWFSVVRGSQGLLQPLDPSVESEQGCGDEAASVFVTVGLPSLPTVWAAGAGMNVEAIDGDGFASCNGFAAPGLGLLEPETGAGGIDGDDLDALDVDDPRSFVLFSLDGALSDPCTGITGNNSGQALGYPPASILMSNLSGNAPNVWATPAQLGLDQAGTGTDDLDALAVWDNGNGTYDDYEVLFDWLNGTSDMVLFSVRRGSAVIGAPDSITGSPIEAGDILVPPVPGVMSTFPGILVPAEALGLATRRIGMGWICQGTMIADDLDALDTTDEIQFDCDGNGKEDAIEIAFDPTLDLDLNGVPDVCETVEPVIYRDARPIIVPR